MSDIDSDLIDQIGQEFDDVEQADDLLGQVPEEDGEPWIPEVAGEGVQGVVVSVDAFPDEFKDGETVPVVVLRNDADGGLVRITGFHGVLRKEIRKSNLRPGDRWAVRYIGKATLKRGPYKGSEAFIYRSAVAHAHTYPAA